MESLIELLENKNIYLSVRNYGKADLATAWEIKSIVDNWDFFGALYLHFPINGICCLDDFLLYLLSSKFVGMKETIPALLHGEHKMYIESLVKDAEEAVQRVNKSDMIRFINNNIHEIFKSEKSLRDIRVVTLDIISEYNKGINKNVWDYLSKECGYLLIDKYDQFERVFERYPDVFLNVFPTGHLDEVNSFRLEKTLDIWQHIIKKSRSALKDIVLKHIDTLESDIKELQGTLTEDNAVQIEWIIREFYLFLVAIKSSKANKFADYAMDAAEILSKSVMDSGQAFTIEIPVEEIIAMWGKTDNWELRLLSLTHHTIKKDGRFEFVSRLSEGPDEPHPIIDEVKCNIPSDEYYTLSHQQKLSTILGIGAGTMMGIIRKQDVLQDYLSLIFSAAAIISEELEAGRERLEEDIKMLSSMVQLLAQNMDRNNSVVSCMCYGLSMFCCALSEKLLRILYLSLIKNEEYIPIYKMTLGAIFSADNKKMADIFEVNHIKNLSFFLQQESESNVGQNIRNSLAHWVNTSTSMMTPVLVAELLWLFTDILNTVFWFCLKDTIAGDGECE